MPTIEAQGVAKLYGRAEKAVGLRDLSLEVDEGRVVALLAPNGAGKTTLVRGLATLLTFDRGTARVAGFDVVREPRRVRERIALVGQGIAVDEQLTAMQNLVLFGRLRGLCRRDAAQRAAALVADFGLAGSENRPVSGFSGGMRRRLDVAVSMITRPDVLFVDEPTTGLDPAARRDLWRVLQDLVARGTTVLLTTQYLEEADALADHIILLNQGEVIAEGSPGELKSMLGRAVLHLRFETAAAAERALPVLARIDASVNRDGPLVAMRGAGGESLFECIQALTAHGMAPSEAALRKPSLDDVFLSLVEDPANKGIGS